MRNIESCCLSFHKVCLKGITFCPICRLHVGSVIDSLGQKAKDAIFHGTHFLDEYDVDSTDNDHFPELEPMQKEITNESIIASIRRLDQAAPKKPFLEKDEVSQPMFIRERKRPPHCKRCGHIRRGHTIRENKESCQLCPGGICVEQGKESFCKCEWHSQKVTAWRRKYHSSNCKQQA